MIRIVTDSSSDIPPDLLEAHSIEVVPLTIRFESQEFVDGLDLTTADFWHRLVTAEALPETAAPSTGLFRERYQAIADSGADGIVVITISSELSGTYQSAVIAAEQFDSPLPIKVIDSASVGMGLGLPVLAAAERATAGASLEEVTATATRAVASTTVIAALDTLEYLKRGGRIGSAQAFFGSLLNIKPIVTLENG
ncbi:MAG: DegV family protein, partial [Acidimicrobiia bacterium]